MSIGNLGTNFAFKNHVYRIWLLCLDAAHGKFLRIRANDVELWCFRSCWLKKLFKTNNRITAHYGDVIMGAIASQITSLTIVYSTVYSDADQRKHQSSASLAFVWRIHPGTGAFPAQMAKNAENVSIWRRHHVIWCAITLMQCYCDDSPTH